MMTPTVHLNGTSADELEAQYLAAYVAMQEALRKLIDAAPNARDYYVQGPDAYRQAREEHDARVTAVSKVCVQLQALYQAVFDVRAERDARRQQRDARLTDEQRVQYATNPHVMQHGPTLRIRDND